MLTVGKVKEWLAAMEFDEEVPETLGNICNNSTFLIWEQLVSKVRPRKEVELITKTVIVNRLQSKSLEDQDEFSYPNKEIETYKRKIDLAKRIDYLKCNIEESERALEEVTLKNQTLYVTIGHTKAKIREAEEKTFLLEKKAVVLSDKIHEVEEIIVLAKNLTPVELEASSSEQEVTETLKKCAEKLAKLNEGLIKTKTRPLSKKINSSLITVKTPKSKIFHSSFTSRGRTWSTNRKNTNKENLSSISRPLFLKASPAPPPERATPKKRESLGLLPDSCLNECDEFDGQFLITSRIKEKDDSSMLLPGNLSTISGNNSSLFATKTTCAGLFDKMLADKFSNDTLAKMLHSTNRELILRVCSDVNEALLTAVRFVILEHNQGASSGCKAIGKEDLAELYFLHIRKHLEWRKNEEVLKKLREAVKRRKDEVLGILVSKAQSKNRSDEITHIFEQQLKEIELEAANQFLQKEVQVQSNTGLNTNELQLINAKTQQTKEEINCEILSVQDLIEQIYASFTVMKRTQEETKGCVAKLSNFVEDVTWSERLQEPLFSQELDIFERFSLDYNKTFKNSGASTPARSFLSTKIPACVDLDSGTLQLVAVLLNAPFAPPESAILNVLFHKLNLMKLRNIKTVSVDLDFTKHSLKELSLLDSKLENIVSELDVLIGSSKVRTTLRAPSKLKDAMDVLFNWPMGSVIPEEKLVDGHNYKFYERKFDSIYKNL